MHYEVRIVTKIDHPERRDSTFPQVQPGTCIPSRMVCSSHAAALSNLEAILRGDYDFASEYVKSVQVVAVDGLHPLRVVRRRIDRTRRTKPAVIFTFNKAA
jgi:hypothetical protein